MKFFHNGSDFFMFSLEDSSKLKTFKILLKIPLKLQTISNTLRVSTWIQIFKYLMIVNAVLSSLIDLFKRYLSTRKLLLIRKFPVFRSNICVPSFL